MSENKYGLKVGLPGCCPVCKTGGYDPDGPPAALACLCVVEAFRQTIEDLKDLPTLDEVDNELWDRTLSDGLQDEGRYGSAED